MNEIFVVMSRSNDECSLNRRWFSTAKDANAYARQVQEGIGCDMYVLRVESGENELESEH